jgi:hypothetical protein
MTSGKIGSPAHAVHLSGTEAEERQRRERPTEDQKENRRQTNQNWSSAGRHEGMEKRFLRRSGI